jgi:cell division protein FtsI/penicillin-binding protein 2
VLAAASVPSRPGAEVGEFQDGERGNVIDRTLRVPRMQPPGSVIKPFVGVWAMQFLGLDPDRPLVSCLPEKPGELPRWGYVHCHVPYGHSVLPFAPLVDLRTALRRSCNVYFARLGDE